MPSTLMRVVSFIQTLPALAQAKGPPVPAAKQGPARGHGQAVRIKRSCSYEIVDVLLIKGGQLVEIIVMKARKCRYCL
jgi:hypothetical protein